jgi:hypothetical protein
MLCDILDGILLVDQDIFSDRQRYSPNYSEDIKKNSTEHSLWINLLYASDDDNTYLSYFDVQ